MYVVDERADGRAFSVESRVRAVEVMANERLHVAAMELIGDTLPGLEIDLGLVKPPTEALAVLRNEARNETASHNGADE
jgi:hypothetical protein